MNRDKEPAPAEREQLTREHSGPTAESAGISKGNRVAYQVMYNDGKGFGVDHITWRTEYGYVTRSWNAGLERGDKVRIAVENPRPGRAKYVERYVRDIALAQQRALAVPLPRFGTVISLPRNMPLRPATPQEWHISALIELDQSSPGDAGFGREEDGQRVRVSGGPRSEVTRQDVIDLRNEADAAGDSRQAAQCIQALRGDALSWYGCAAVILHTRMETAREA